MLLATFEDMAMDVPDEGAVPVPRSSAYLHSLLSRPSACGLLVQALKAGGRVDFPTVTEICEGVAGNVEEMVAVVRLLSDALQKRAGKTEDSLLSLQLKALTVAHELLYDADARLALIEAPGLLAAVSFLRAKHRQQVRCSPPAVECVRLLASEICRTLNVNLVCQL